MNAEINPLPATPMLFPFQPDQFWQMMRQLIREEIAKVQKKSPADNSYHTPGLIEKPLYKMVELCKLLQVSKPTIYQWIKIGKLQPYKIRSRVYFLWQDVQQLIMPEQNASVIPLQQAVKPKAA